MRARDYARRGLPVFATGQALLPRAINGVPIADLLTPAQQAALLGVDYRDALTPVGVDRQRNNFSVTLSQRLGVRGGSLYFNGSLRDYWNRDNTDMQFQLGYNNVLGRLNYNLSASRERDLFGGNDNRYMLNITVPLGDGMHRPMLTGGLAHDSNGMQEQATLSGTAGIDERYSYGASASHASGDDRLGSVGSTANLNAGYRGSHVQLNAGFGAGSGYSQASFNAAGGIIAYAGGVGFSQSLGDTVAIVQAPDAKGARVVNAAGVRIDRAGYAVVPFVTPYIQNTISLDPTGVPLDVQLDSTSAQVAPRAGTVVVVKFKSESGRFVLIQALRADGNTLPFGAEVTDADGQTVGMVGQAGRIMARVRQASGQLSVQWDEQGATQTCVLPYRLPPRAKGKRGTGSIEQIEATCEQPRTTAQVARSGT
jgi:outer membrane usher protein